jgi:hypothetical protein
VDDVEKVSGDVAWQLKGVRGPPSGNPASHINTGYHMHHFRQHGDSGSSGFPVGLSIIDIFTG